MTRQQREIELHKALSDQYDVRHGAAFSRVYHHHWNQTMLALAGTYSGTALDCGCGTGVLIEDLLTRYDVTGFDISADMLHHAPLTVREGARLTVASLEALPFPDNHFDMAFCRGSLHHAADLEQALANIRRVLKPGGLLILSEPCSDSLLLRLPRWWWRTRSDRFDDDHFALGSDDLHARLAAHGLLVTHQRKFGFVAFPLCGLSDILPLLHHVSFAVPLTRLLMRFDDVCAHVPLLRDQSWHVMLRAVCEK